MAENEQEQSPRSEQERKQIFDQSIRLRQALFERNKDPKTLSAELQIDDSTVRKWLDGHHRCSQLTRIAEWLDVRQEWLILGSGDMTESQSHRLKRIFSEVVTTQNKYPELIEIKLTVGEQTWTVTKD